MQRVPILAVTGGLVVLVVGSFLPWASSGSRSRSSYELVRVADRLDLLPGGWQSGAARAWFATPLVAALAAAAPLARHHLAPRVGAVAAAAVAVFALVLVVMVHRSPLTADVGTTTSAVGAVATLVGAVVLSVTTPRTLTAPARR